MHPCAMKVQQNGHKCHAATQSLEKRSISVLIHSCSANYVTLSIYYYVTLPFQCPPTRRGHNSEKRANCGVRIFAMLMLNENESTFAHELNLD